MVEHMTRQRPPMLWIPPHSMTYDVQCQKQIYYHQVNQKYMVHIGNMSQVSWFLQNDGHKHHCNEKRIPSQSFKPNRSQLNCYLPNNKLEKIQNLESDEKMVEIEEKMKKEEFGTTQEIFQPKTEFVGSPVSASTADKIESKRKSSDSKKETTLAKRNANGRSGRQKNKRKSVQRCNKTSCYHIQDSAVFELGLSEKQLYANLNDYTLMPQQLFIHGYPDLSRENKVRVLKPCFSTPLQVYHETMKCQPGADSHINSRIPDICEGNPSGKSSLESPSISEQSNSVERMCVRCGNTFFTTDVEYLTKERCCFHWGKLLQYIYTCCKKSAGSVGCTSSKLHVWNGTVAGINEPLEGFVKTKRSKTAKKQKVYALDCEMCYTVKGLELCKVTILAYNGTIVYDHFVKPENEVVDYNTKYSGVTESDVNSEKSKTFAEVQSDVLKLVNDDTILVGHGLDNDLRVLKLLHSRVVDTALIFPHARGYPFRYSLKYLMWSILQKQIQTSDSGHNPYEDALSCLELISFKIRIRHDLEYLLLKDY